MATVINFPSLADREWAVWEDAIRSMYQGGAFGCDVLDMAIPRIKSHWEVLFKPATIEAPPRQLPGELTEEQVGSIYALLQANTQLVIDYHKTQRAVALGRLIECEFALAHLRVRGT